MKCDENLSISDLNNYLSYWGDLSTWISIFQDKQILIFENKPYYQFPKGRLNRINIVSSQGVQQLSIPIRGGRKNKLAFKDIKIDYTIDWQKNHYRSIKSCYGKAPWWKEYEDDLQRIYEQKKVFLLEWNIKIYEWISYILALEINYISSSCIINNQYQTYTIKPYQQVFGTSFYNNVFILDAILCQGEKILKQYFVEYNL